MLSTRAMERAGFWLVCSFLSIPSLGTGAFTRSEKASKAPIRMVEFVGANHAWVLHEGGAVHYTNDGGKSWHESSPIPTFQFLALSFIDSTTGWAFDDDGQVTRTTDGGVTWKIVAKPAVIWSPFLIQDIKFVDSQHGWLLDPFAIWRTEDGGTNWRRYVPLEGSSKSKSLTHQSFFLNERIGWLGGERGVLYRTNDGGKSWEEQRVVFEKDADISGIFFITERTGWASCWPNGGIYFTNDGGTSWKNQPLPAQELQIASLHFLNEKEGWAVGEGESLDSRELSCFIVHTKDGGRSWEKVQMEKRLTDVTRIYFADAQRGWLTTNDGVYRTNDRGKTWHSVLTFQNTR